MQPNEVHARYCYSILVDFSTDHSIPKKPVSCYDWKESLLLNLLCCCYLQNVSYIFIFLKILMKIAIDGKKVTSVQGSDWQSINVWTCWQLVYSMAAKFIDCFILLHIGQSKFKKKWKIKKFLNFQKFQKFQKLKKKIKILKKF